MKKLTKQTGWLLFLQLCQELSQTDKLNEFFDLFLTPEEKDDIAARVLIIQHLLEGKLTQRDIAEHIEVSIAKITRGSNYLKHIDDEFKNLLAKKL